MEQEKKIGFQVFDDVFRRIDKNDDGKLQWEEFSSYFDDEYISETELKKLFDACDLDKDGVLSLAELRTFFYEGFHDYSPIYSCMSDLSDKIHSVFLHLAQKYPAKTTMEQFKTRFYIAEFLNIMDAISTQTLGVLNDLERQTGIECSSEQKSEDIMADFSEEKADLKYLAQRLERMEFQMGNLVKTLQTRRIIPPSDELPDKSQTFEEDEEKVEVNC